MGRQLIEINWAQVEKMIEAQCPVSEICEILEIDESTFYKRIKSEKKTNFQNYSRKFHSTGKRNVRLIQYNKALQGNVPMLIRWGEEYLGQGRAKLEEKNQKINITINEINPVCNTTTEQYDRNAAPVQMPTISEFCMECTEIPGD